MYSLTKALRHKIKGSKSYQKAKAYNRIAGWFDEGPNNWRNWFQYKNRSNINSRLRKNYDCD